MLEESKTKISPYIVGIKDRKIRDIIARYLEAYTSFKNYNRLYHEGIMMSFSNLRKVHDMLWDMKENYHLLFRRVLNPKKKIFEPTNKFTPSDDEIKFMNNIGLLFHKVMVARELKYVLDYYEEDSDSYQETKASLERNLDRINSLFEQGLQLLLQILGNYQNNIQLITYFLEHREQCEAIFKRKIEELLQMLSRGRSIEDVYIDAIHYYQNSGWNDRANKMLRQLLKINPKHEKALMMWKAFAI